MASSLAGRLVASMVLWLGCAALHATPLVEVNALGTCVDQENRQSCSELGILTGWHGTPLPESLADLYTLSVITGDRSKAMVNGLWLARILPPALAAEASAAGQEELIVSSEMVYSVQMSLDPRLDASGPRPSPIESMHRASQQKAVSAASGQAAALDRRQVELTLGTVVNSIQIVQNVSTRSAAKSDYMSFSLVNQLHFNSKPSRESQPGAEPEAEADDLP